MWTGTAREAMEVEARLRWMASRLEAESLVDCGFGQETIIPDVEWLITHQKLDMIGVISVTKRRF